MEDFYDFESQSETKLPTSFEIKEIKKMLLTGEKDQILRSVEKIKKFLNTQKSVSEILRSDILEFLCDAVLPFDSVVACNLYQCIEIMVTHIEFYTHNHSLFAVESLMRTLHFLMKDYENPKGLNQCLNLLNIILQGYNSHNVGLEKRTVENLLQVLSALKNLSPTVNNKYQTGAFILNLIDLNMLKWSREVCNLILDSLSCWFGLISEVLEFENLMKEKLIVLCCTICYSALRVLLSNEKKFSFEINENIKSGLIMNIIDFVITIGAPYFDNVPLINVQTNPSDLENFYQVILCFYTDETTSEKKHLIHGLSETGFLQFTTKIISIATSSQCQKLRGLCILALFYMILYLSEDVFYFPDVWPKGRDDFRFEVQRGISHLPVNATEWLDVLVTPNGSFSSKLVLLLYLYFYSMTAKSQDLLQDIYPAVVGFIRCNEDVRSCVLLLKVVWFVFVISQLSISQSSSLQSDPEENDEMVAILESQQDLSLVYTHHPALLYWAFSSRVSTHIQTQTVHLWLKNKTPDCKELDELMKTSPDVRYAVLDILQNGWGHELDSAFSCLKSLLLNSDSGDDIADSIWYLLPQVLAKFTAGFTSVTNVDYIIELSSLTTPKSLDVTKLIRVATLLPEVLLNSDLLSIIPFLSLILRLVRLGSFTEDKGVLWVFLRHNIFLQKIIEMLNTNVSHVLMLSIEIMVVFWKECLIAKNTEVKKIKINKEVILKMLNTTDTVLSASLCFLEVVLESNFQSSVFEIDGIDSDFLEVLFLEIQNACIKTSIENSKRCWRCLTLFLLRPQSNVDEWVTNPLLNELILCHLPHLNDLQEFRNFLDYWMEFHNVKINDPCFGRKIFGKFYTETQMRVEKQLQKVQS